MIYLSQEIDKAKVNKVQTEKQAWPLCKRLCNMEMLRPIYHWRCVKRLFNISALEITCTGSFTTLNSNRIQRPKSNFKVIQSTPPDPIEAERNGNNFKQLLEQYSKHVELAKSGGGETAVQRHTVKQKKLLVTERLRLLLDDADDFLELGLSAGLGMPYGDVPRAGLITGIICSDFFFHARI